MLSFMTTPPKFCLSFPSPLLPATEGAWEGEGTPELRRRVVCCDEAGGEKQHKHQLMARVGMATVIDGS